MLELQQVLQRARAFEKAAHAILSLHETVARSRIIYLEETYRALGELSLQQDELFRQSLRCIENELFRAAHVMAWAGFMDYFEERLAVNSFAKLKAVRPKWTFATIEELREQSAEYQLVEAGAKAGLCSKNEMKALHGLLNKRNECAHPSSYFPGLNESLGYMAELLRRIEALKKRAY
jgi:hypothetical protein